MFGVCCEGIPRQINDLIDEASDVGKGANMVVSLLHHFLEHHGLGEIDVGLHADNCVGRNKNNTVLQVFVHTYIGGGQKTEHQGPLLRSMILQRATTIL